MGKNIYLSGSTKIFRKNKSLFVHGPNGTSHLDISFLNNELKKKKINLCFLKLLQKKKIGVSLNYVKILMIKGIGFRVEIVENNFLKLKLGFSHVIMLKIPQYITISISKKSLLVFKSFDEQLLNEFCSKIYAFKKPDQYKGKGILYKNQKILIKKGKKK